MLANVTVKSSAYGQSNYSHPYFFLIGIMAIAEDMIALSYLRMEWGRGGSLPHSGTGEWRDHGRLYGRIIENNILHAHLS